MKNTNEILEGNKLIAEFMEYMFLDDFNYPENNETGWYNELGNCVGIELKFHSSWDWLMSVVEKIELIIVDELKIEEDITINGTSCYIPAIDKSITKLSKINATYEAVVEFIKWYNLQKNVTDL